ncbi:TetR/AcrR family transcriptional regulator [Bradyrhizobium sp. LHD-71]|uniref:TetR/AcrR family transcriptional regulator n=1 Tax=Bradyrhizobium sp. LHD-71 TaxID=3072141 RepID=UPI00280C7557|nr:TetR/AcrR family transcriptional regulator [Bradyrhizobium sp. LHD-71]MDQ8728202.1 TetR/AcrR family transcriptional regulator [Bradyrhizobium sp. LHD-71]
MAPHTTTRQAKPRSASAPSKAFDKKAQHRQKRMALMQEAARLINTRGMAAVSLDEVGSRLNISKTAIYYYFKSKQELIYECYAMSFEVWQTALDEGQRRGETGRQKLEIFLREYLDRGLNELQPIVVAREQEVLEGPLYQKVAGRRRALRNGIRAFVDEGIADRSLRQLNAKVATTIIGASISWLLRTYQPGAGLDQQAFIDEAVNQLLCGLSS